MTPRESRTAGKEEGERQAGVGKRCGAAAIRRKGMKGMKGMKGEGETDG